MLRPNTEVVNVWPLHSPPDCNCVQGTRRPVAHILSVIRFCRGQGRAPRARQNLGCAIPYRAELTRLGMAQATTVAPRRAGRGQARGVGLVVKRVTCFPKALASDLCLREGLSCATPS
jgi:hypothetical protein